MSPHKPTAIRAVAATAFILSSQFTFAQTVYVSRMWHNHQPIYWPEWNSNGSQNSRVEYAWDSIVMKSNRSYPGSTAQHPENDLGNIFGIDDRKNAYQSGPRNSLASCPSSAGFCLSYSGSLMRDVQSLGNAGQLGYGSNWWDGNREARNWFTGSGGRRLDLVGFTYHHSLAPLLPKSVFHKELDIFKQAYWKAWNGNSNLSDHSKGFFPTEMAFSTSMIDVLADQGYDWSIVASHHLSRTCPTYMDQGTENLNIFSSLPNKADQLGPSPTSGWWYSMPNPGNAAWNVAPFAYQLHKAKYVNPETGAEKFIILVPSDDVLSYRFGYANEGINKIQSNIAPFANDPNKPCLVMPSTDGDNAWGGGSSSWFEATPQFFNDSQNSGYAPCSVQDLVNSKGANADLVHIEDGAWIFPESDYGSPYFLKWIEPPVAATPANRYANTIVDMETPGFALKFWAWAPVITGANWCETAEQILNDEGGSVQAWKVEAPYDWNGSWSSPNDVEQAWHIYLCGLDSGFNYYGGLGNDDEVKAALATTRAIQKLQPWMTPSRLSNDRTAPSVLKPQRFPWNPGGYTFGWFNSIPGGDTSYRKQMPSEFYIWTHAYDVSGLSTVNLKVRIDNDGTNTMANNQNETYAGGSDVGVWTTIPMTMRQLPNTQSALNAAANNGQINYFITPPELADYYFAKITDANLYGFRGKLLDYYIEATDTKGNTSKSDIQHVFVEDDGGTGPEPDPVVETSPAEPTDCQPLTITYNPAGRNLANASQVYIHIGHDNWLDTITPRPAMTLVGTKWEYTYTPANGTAVVDFVFTNAAGGTATVWDNNSGSDWHVNLASCGTPAPPPTPTALVATATGTTTVSLDWANSTGATSYTIFRDSTQIGTSTTSDYNDSGLTASTSYTYTVLASNSVGDSAQSSPASATTLTPVVSTAPAVPTDCAQVTITYNPAGRVLDAASQVYIHIGHDGWDDVADPRPAMTLAGSVWEYTYTPQTGQAVIDVVFTDAADSTATTWDNNGGQDWHIALTACSPVIPATPANLMATAASPTVVSLSWEAVPGATTYHVYRGGTMVATLSDATWFDTGRTPETTYSYSVSAMNSVGESAQSGAVSVTTPSDSGGTEIIPFNMDGSADSEGYKLSSPGMTIYAALRGTTLYVATWAPGSSAGNDHFVMIGNSALASATTAAPWAKSGTVALPVGSPYLAAESSSAYIGWFNTGVAATESVRGAEGQQIEGTVDVSEAFGTTPSGLYLAALAYQTADGGLLGSQAPALVDDNGNVDPSELFFIPLEALRDEDANGIYDLLEPGKAFKITSITKDAATASLTWKCFPGKTYKIQTSTTLESGDWTFVQDGGSDMQVTAGSSDMEISATIPLNTSETKRFYRIVLP